MKKIVENEDQMEQLINCDKDYNNCLVLLIGDLLGGVYVYGYISFLYYYCIFSNFYKLFYYEIWRYVYECLNF